MKVIKPNIVCITTFRELSYDECNKFINDQERFIIRRLNEIKNEEINTDKIHFLGKEYKLIIINADYDSIRIENNIIIITTINDSKEYIRYLIHRMYTEALSKIVKGNIEKIKKDMDIHFTITFLYKDVLSYYGKCYFSRRVIVLQTSLAKYEMKYIISVIYHEMAHFYYQDHQEGFYNLLESKIPGYKKLQHELRMIKYREIY